MKSDEVTTEVYDDDKAEDMLASVISDIRDFVKPGWTEFLRAFQPELSKKIKAIENELTIAKLNADMKSFRNNLPIYTILLLECCRQHRRHLEVDMP